MTKLTLINNWGLVSITESKHYPVVVVGAGVAGITAAYWLARAGVKVLLLERGPFPGSKNMSGGAVYSLPTREILPDFWQEAPLERVLTEQQYWLLTETSGVKMGFTSTDLGRPPYNRVSVLRSTFDRWYAAKAVEAGVYLWAGCKVAEIIPRLNRLVVNHVDSDYRETISADIIILAEGVNRLLAERAGLGGPPKAKNCALYVKEIMALPEEVINDRFHLKGNQGAVIGILGDNTAGLIGTGSIYTFRRYIGINTGVSVQMLADRKVNPGQLLERTKRHPLIEPLIRGGTTVEYMAHMIPEGGYNSIPPLVFDGIMVVGDAAGLVNGTHGINLAMYSGKFAADTAIEALNKGAFSRRALKSYKDRLNQSFVLRDLKDNRGIPGWLSDNPSLFDDYIGLVNHLAFQLTAVYPIAKSEKRRMIRRELLSMRSPGKMAVDAFNAAWRII